MKFNLFMTSVLVIMLSMVVSKIVYFGFTPNYGADIFARRAFDAKFDHGGDRYRVLSKYMVYGADGLLGRSMKEGGAEARVRTITGGASERFYYAIYYVNTLFLALTSLMVVLLLNLDKSLKFSDPEKMLLVFFVPILLGLTQFTVHYYDLSSYFLELLILYVFLKNIDSRYGQTMTTIMGLVVLSTLNRESAEVSVALIAVLLLTRFGATRRVVWSIVGMVGCWVVTYVALRLAIGAGGPPPKAAAGAGNGFEPDMFMMGVIFWVLFIYLPFALAATEENKYLIGGFFVLSIPYIISSLAGGDLWAVRLYVPLFLGALFLSRLDVAADAVRISDAITRRRPANAGRLSEQQV
ncbi:MAG TPA: hypothetical protein VG101_10150 [Puia sp.]|jgi:hypothetical protein|nr:hypothetical protein [Puia sp.]